MLNFQQCRHFRSKMITLTKAFYTQIHFVFFVADEASNDCLTFRFSLDLGFFNSKSMKPLNIFFVKFNIQLISHFHKNS